MTDPLKETISEIYLERLEEHTKWILGIRNDPHSPHSVIMKLITALKAERKRSEILREALEKCEKNCPMWNDGLFETRDDKCLFHREHHIAREALANIRGEK